MAFYSPTWVRALIKEDHKTLQASIDKSSSGFRDYIDSTLPFVLYLDIGEIRERVIGANRLWVEELAELSNVSAFDLYIALDKAYQATINSYIEKPKYVRITDVELQKILEEFAAAVASGINIKSTMQRLFKQTMIVTNLSKKNQRVMLILPKFNTLEFGKEFKIHFQGIADQTFSDLISDGPEGPNQDSPRNIIKNFVNGNFSKLQNIGHVEIDVYATNKETGRAQVKRGQNSPRLLQALLALPKGVNPEPIARNFSKSTGQTKTRLLVRKNFNTKKMVMELLVEAGMSVGLPESFLDNNTKSAKEAAFEVGKGFIAALRKDKTILANLETSKSIKTYLTEEILSTLRKGKSVPTYTSNTEIVQQTPTTYTSVKLDLKKSYKPNNTQLPRGKEKASTFINLQALLDAKLKDQVESNMGTGDDSRVLNYRSGRFAESVKVQRVSESRQGMITAFYTYMKNPYATFSDGGAQEYPRTRDPKLLIAKSIREVASTLVSNKLRSVLI